MSMFVSKVLIDICIQKYNRQKQNICAEHISLYFPLLLGVGEPGSI